MPSLCIASTDPMIMQLVIIKKRDRDDKSVKTSATKCSCNKLSYVSPSPLHHISMTSMNQIGMEIHNDDYLPSLPFYTCYTKALLAKRHVA